MASVHGRPCFFEVRFGHQSNTNCFLANRCVNFNNRHVKRSLIVMRSSGQYCEIKVLAFIQTISGSRAVAWNALPNAVKDSGSLSAFRINLKRHIRTLLISKCSPCMYYRGIIVVLFNQGLVEKQLFIIDERVTLNKYISNEPDLVF